MRLRLPLIILFAASLVQGGCDCGGKPAPGEDGSVEDGTVADTSVEDAGPDTSVPDTSVNEGGTFEDVDGDGVLNNVDNCPQVSNTLQEDHDVDGEGDACDNCVDVANDNQNDADNDGQGDACEEGLALADDDMDGLANAQDNCPSVANGPEGGPNNQTDSDGDSIGDVCDNCPTIANATNQHAGFMCPTDHGTADGDDDNDGVDNEDDNCPDGVYPGGNGVSLPADSQNDGDGDGVGDVCDVCPMQANSAQTETSPSQCDDLLPGGGDADGDGVDNNMDNCPTGRRPGNTVPLPDSSQQDTDDDGFGDICDSCPNAANADQSNVSVCDPNTAPGGDADNDGVNNGTDNCRNTPNGPLAGPNNQTDTDNDGRGNACDNCPTIANYDQADANSDGIGDICRPDVSNPLGDFDGDGIQNGRDNCDTVVNPMQTDLDFDDVGDACDTCVCHPSASLALRNGCGSTCAYSDMDNDGVSAYQDNCPSVTNPRNTGGTQDDTDSDGVGDACDSCVTVANNTGGVNDPFECSATNPAYPDGDYDMDGVINRQDNCRLIANPRVGGVQPDADNDGMGDVCDTCPQFANANPNGTPAACPDPSLIGDSDMDMILNYQDNCPAVPNMNQADADGDHIGDLCDTCPNQASNLGNGTQLSMCDAVNASDQDGDGVNANSDNCPTVANMDQADGDGDGVGNVCDNCPAAANPMQQDVNDNMVGDHCETITSIPAPCASESSQSSPVAPNLYFVIDNSGSMDNSANCTGCGTRAEEWNEAVDALKASLAMDYNLGASRFSGSTCGTQPVQSLAITVAGTGGLANTWDTAASLTSPSGGTPTAAALQGVRTRALYDRAGDPLGATRPRAVVLVTDGDPQGCAAGHTAPSGAGGNNTSDFFGTVEEARALALLGIPVYVIGFTGLNINKMEAIAWAGNPANNASYRRGALCDCSGSCNNQSDDFQTNCWCDGDGGGNGNSPTGCYNAPTAWYPVSDQASITAAIASIRQRIVSCTLPVAVTGDEDLGLRTVNFVTSSGTCGDSPTGNCVVPNNAMNGYTISGTTMTLNGTWCTYLSTKVNTDVNAAVEIDVGCRCVAVPGEVDCNNPLGDVNCNGRLNDQCAGTPEVCGDGIDNNGNSMVDENCTAGCVPAPEICDVPVPPATMPNDEDCDGMRNEGCPTNVCVPTAEVCTDAIDNDCDGMTNEFCTGTPSCMPPACTAAGQMIDTNCDMTPDYTCAGPGMVPPTEQCGDNMDNDGDMQVDEGCFDPDCTPAPEVCDGDDDDCDGVADNGCPTRGCVPSLEVCTPPNPVDDDCDGLADEGCSSACIPYNEVCGDNLDNDCDLMVDEDCTPACVPYTEICDGVDNNCDGMIDNSCVTCSGDMGYEVCDGIDNDCDEMVDEGCPPIIIID